ncbi:MAG: hypothetical protein L6Q99_03385 [Planctomycetes bacterium]|nr:hypothetical protein [Planctomycetota bacterium]
MSLSPRSLHSTVLGSFALLLAACGGGGGGGSESTVISGFVLTPGGQGVPAPLGGLAPVPDGTLVRLARIDAAGALVAVLADDATKSGSYSFDLDELGVRFATDLVVVAGGGAGAMRAWAVEKRIDVDPVAEAVLQLAIGQAPMVDDYTLDEARDLDAAVRLLCAAEDVVAQADVAATVDAVKQAVGANAGLTAFFAAAAGAGQTSIGPGDVGDYFPLDVTNAWRYAGTHTSALGLETYVHDERVIAESLGVTTVRSTNVLGVGGAYDQRYSKTDRALVLVGSDDPDDPVSAAVAPYELLRFPLRANDAFEQFDVDDLAVGDVDGDGKGDHADFRSVSKLIGFEDVSIAAGDFANCARFQTKLTTRFWLTSGIPASATATETLWLAPRRGPVRVTAELSVQVAGVKTSEGWVEETTGFQVAGDGHAFVPPFDVAVGVMPANSDLGSPGRAAVGFDGGEHLVVTVRDAGFLDRLVGVLVGPTGAVQDEFEIVQATSHMFGEPSVAFDGTNYLVVYGDNATIRGVRVSPNGAVLDPGGFGLTPVGGSAFGATVSFDGANYLVAWRRWDAQNASDVYACFVSPAGIAGNAFAAATGAGDQVEPELVFDGSHHALVWRSEIAGVSAIRGARITTAGVVLASFDVVAGSSGLSAPSFAFDGTNHLVVWHRVLSPGGETEVLARRIAADGTALDLAPFAVVSNAAPNGGARVAFDGTNWIVAWDVRDYDDGGLHARRISPAGVLLDGAASTSGLLIEAPTDYAERLVLPTWCVGDGRCLLVWVRNREVSGTLKDVCASLVYPF